MPLNGQMDTLTAAAAAARATLAQLAEGQLPVEIARVAEALGVRPEALQSAADRAYPLSQGDSAVQYLLRDFSTSLRSEANRMGLDAALAELAVAVSDPNPERLSKFLAGSQRAGDR